MSSKAKFGVAEFCFSLQVQRSYQHGMLKRKISLALVASAGSLAAVALAARLSSSNHGSDMCSNAAMRPKRREPRGCAEARE